MQNPPPGALVDSGCTTRNYFEFYLVPQHVTQGTATPSSYHVIHMDDRLPWDAKTIQSNTFILCNLYLYDLSTHLFQRYYNWAGPIRVPAPVQYAHKLAYLATQYLKREPPADAAELHTFLHFL